MSVPRIDPSLGVLVSAGGGVFAALDGAGGGGLDNVTGTSSVDFVGAAEGTAAVGEPDAADEAIAGVDAWGDATPADEFV